MLLHITVNRFFNGYLNLIGGEGASLFDKRTMFCSAVCELNVLNVYSGLVWDSGAVPFSHSLGWRAVAVLD